MASKALELFLLSMLYFITKPSTLIEGQQVPCLFIMGDSIFDNGNNNFLITLAKSNYSPYSVDYPDGPTGRFSNGKHIPDFLAEHLGFEKPIPPFATANGAEILKGVNYASAGAGILEESRKGGRFSMNQQLFNHGVTISKIALLLENTTLAKEHLNKCMYVVNMGTNEYVNNYLVPPIYLSSFFYTPQQFAAIATKRYAEQLRSLYKYGAKKVVVYGLGLIGCLPQKLITNHTNGLICDNSINKIVEPFNDRMMPIIDALNADLDAAQFILINTNSITRGDHSSLGQSEAGKEICNRNEYRFWDNYHLSEIGNRIVLAARSYDAELYDDAYPIDIRRLAQQ